MSIKVRISQIKKDIVVKKLDSEEMLDIPLVDYEDIIEYSIYDEPVDVREMISDFEYITDYARIISVASMCVKDFDDKISDALLDLSPREAVAALFDIYIACVMVNPAIDEMTNALKNSMKPLPDDLEEVTELLPDNIATSIKKHLYKDSFIDSLQLVEIDEDELSMFELTIDDLLTDLHEMAFDVERVKGLLSELHRRVIGQKHAADHLYAVVRRLAVGFRDNSKPPAVLLFAGPTGVGKTLMAKVSTEYLFDSKTKFGRIDCSNLSEKHDVSKLLGAPPGYVGYPSDRGGDPKEQDPALIYREVSKMGQDGGVLLLDEVEKAHPDIWDTFLTAFDEGYVKTSVGNVVDLRNVIIIMTTNLGSKEFDDMQRKNPIGFNDKAACAINFGDDVQMVKTIKRTASEALRKYMKPEMIGRITDVVPFANLSVSELKDVTNLEWDKARLYLSERLPEVHLTEELKEHIASAAAERKLGARPVQRMIEQFAVDAVAEMFVEHNSVVKKAESIIIDIDENNGFCDSVRVIIGDEEYDYEVKQTLSED